MRACANGKKEIATILYHWNSNAAKIKTPVSGMTAAQLATLSSCPQLGQQLEQQKRREQQTEPVISVSKQESDVIFVKPVQQQRQRVGTRTASFIRAPSLDRQLYIPSTITGTLVRSTSSSPLGTTSTMRSALASIRNLREGSPASSQRDEPTQVIRLRLRKQPSVDSGINLDVHAVKNMQKDVKKLSK